MDSQKKFFLLIKLYVCPSYCNKQFFKKMQKYGGTYQEYLILWGYKSFPGRIRSYFLSLVRDGVLIPLPDIIDGSIITYYRIDKEKVAEQLKENENFKLSYLFFNDRYGVLNLESI